MARFSRLDKWVALFSGLSLAAVAALIYWDNAQRPPAQIAYLYPALAPTQDIWLAPFDNPSAARRLTQSARGIYDFDVHPDGQSIVYAERNNATTTDLKRVHIATGATQTLLDCAAQAADCKNPAIHPQGRLLAYERSEQGANNRYGAVRIWLLDLDNLATHPLFADSQIIGHSPVWSADGRKIAFLTTDALRPGIIIYDLNPPQSAPAMKLVSTQYNTMGALSPRGDKLAYFDIANGAPQIFIVDLQTNQVAPIAQTALQDTALSWHPQTDQLAIARQVSAETGHRLYRLDVLSGALTPLFLDDGYTILEIAWDTHGEHLIVGGYPSGEGRFRPQIWVWSATTNELALIADEAFLAKWVVAKSD